MLKGIFMVSLFIVVGVFGVFATKAFAERYIKTITLAGPVGNLCVDVVMQTNPGGGADYPIGLAGNGNPRKC